MNCAGPHLSEQCDPMKNAQSAARKKHQEDGNTDKVVQLDFPWKCANCNGNHRADDRQCKKIVEYGELQRRLANRNRQHQKGFQYREDSFPNTLQASLTPPEPATGTSYSKASGNAGKSHDHQMSSDHTFHGMGSSSSSAKVGNSNSNPNLFTFQEINSLTHEMLRGLSACKDKFEQFEVITNLATKYLYGSK